MLNITIIIIVLLLLIIIIVIIILSVTSFSEVAFHYILTFFTLSHLTVFYRHELRDCYCINS